LVEFAICAFLLSIMLLAGVELGRMVLVYTTVANCARAAVRYAVVHGSTRTGTGADGPSGPADNPTQVVTTAKNFASMGALDTTKLEVTVKYPGSSNSVGALVNVTVVYPYIPLISYLPLTKRLGSTTQGVILF